MNSKNTSISNRLTGPQTTEKKRQNRRVPHRLTIPL
jgi:hypothetical protein